MSNSKSKNGQGKNTQGKKSRKVVGLETISGGAGRTTKPVRHNSDETSPLKPVRRDSDEN